MQHVKFNCRTYSCISQTESLDDWLGPWVSFLWLVFLIASIFSVRMIYKTYVKFRDTIARRTGKTYEFKEDVAYETENALGCWNISEKPVEKRIKILYRIYVIPLLIAWLDLFLDIGYVSSFTTNSTRMVSPYIDVRQNEKFIKYLLCHWCAWAGFYRSTNC